LGAGGYGARRRSWPPTTREGEHIMRMPTRLRAVVAAGAVPALLLSACGNGDEEDLQAFCDIAAELDEGDDFPTAEQLEAYKAAAPSEIRDEATFAADALIEALESDDMADVFALFGDPEFGAAIERIEEFEAEACGFEAADLPAGVSTEIDPNAQRVDVSAIDYDFIFDAPSAGPVSFVMTNDGDEPHFMGIGKLRDGVTLQDALTADDPDEVTEFIADSDVVGPGGEAVLTFENLEPGNYGMVCFIPTPDGVPHAFEGMAVEFTVE
jgi:hypothetical protein